MAKQLNPSEVAEILRRGTFDDLVGALEDEHLECKAAPYQLQHEPQKYELAKDVSMVVNRSARSGGEGGHLLLGVRTEPSLEYHADMVAEVRPFDRGLVNPKQYLDVLHDWLTPAPEGLDVAWFPSAADAARGIVAITVPPQPRDRWPCIVGKVIDEGGKRRGVAVSYVERHGEHAVEWTPAEFQRLLREGARADTVSNQLAALGEQMARLSEQVQRGQVPPAAPPGPSDAAQTYGVRLGMAVTAANLRGAAVYALTVAPIDTVTLPTLFRGPNEALPRLLADPPRFRGGGWDMAVRGELDVVEGRLRRGVAPGSKILECWYDGALVHAADATGYLCWGPKTRGDVRRINPMALAESTLLFAMLAEAVYANHATPRPTAVRFGLSLQRLDVGARTMLSSGGIKSAGFEWDMNVKQAPGRDFEFVVDVGDTWTPGEVAYSLTRSVYLWFGFTEEQIPYVAEEEGVRRITREKLLADAGP